MTPKLTVEDVRHHAEEVRSIAQRDVKRVFEDQVTQTIVVAGVAVLTLMSVAYLLGSRRAAQKAMPAELPPGPPLR